MKITTFILIIALAQVSAKSFSQKITIVKSGISIEAVFNQIKTQSGYSILYKDVDFHKTKIDANIRNVSLEEALKVCLKDLPVDYKIDSKTKIILLKSEKNSIANMLTDIATSFFRSINIRGIVIDSAGNPITGAIVRIKGSNITTTTNNKGEFFIKNIDESALIVISYLGYEKKEIKVKTDLGNIELKVINTNLEEVKINAGYYKVSDKERTGSISKITAKDIERQPVSNLLATMQANIPGIQITQTTGVPGGGFNVQIRGRNSISQGNNPFYVIDGVPFTATTILPVTVGQLITPNPSPLSSINPADIESIEVLKDADATAIYGSRGANGVILITTKKGKTGKSKATVSISHGISRVGRQIKLMNTEQYLEMRKEAYFTNDKLTTSSSQFATQYDLNGSWDENAYTNWQKELIGGNAPLTNAQTSLSGGTPNIQYQVGGGYYKEGTVFPGDQSLSRASGNFSLQYSSDNRKFNANLSSTYSKSKSNLFTADITSYIYLPPNYPSLLNTDGSLNWQNNTMFFNPVGDTRNPFKIDTDNLISNGLISYSLLPDLKISTSVGYTTSIIKNYSALLTGTQSPANLLPRSASFGNNSIGTWIVEPQINWNRKLGKNKLDVLFGMTFQESVTDGQNITGTGYTSDALLNNIGSASLLTVSSRQYLQYRYAAIYSRLNYIFNEKYIVNATARRDGSTRFGSDKQFANFGAIGAAWIISNENILKRLYFISFAKLRGSYGITGNDQIGDYGYLSLWGNNLTNPTYQANTTIKPEGLANPDYAWEINKKLEAALEIGVLDNRLNFEVNFYSNRSTNQLVGRQLAPSIGFTSIQDNLPAIVRNTGWEFMLNSKNIARQDIQWSTSINLTIPENKLLSYPGLKTSGADANFYEVGFPLNIKKLYNTYLDVNSGLFVREDYDNNGILDNNDKYVIQFLGRNYYGGIQNTFTYKGIELDFSFQFVKQTGLTGLPSSTPGRFRANTGNQPIEVLDRWQSVGENTKFQKFTTLSASATADMYAKTEGSLAVENSSFIRMKNLSLSYSLPKNIVERLKINHLKFYLQGQNIFTITKYKGLDPEGQNGGFLPALQTFTGGVQLTL
ncbi:SusC/RagA family TonB-linked outer membrane protein [Pedobacter africanus]|nr:SusC/RagA family TonB-linked outer membrane protein [Pedobacter africanus]